MATLFRIGGAEPSTLTFKVRTVQINQNSSNMQQEILTIGDPNSSLALAECSSLVPSSTQVGLVTKEAGGFLSSVGGVVTIAGNSTVFQGGSPWGVSFPAGNISSVAQTGNSSGLTVRPVWSSSNTDQPVRAVLSSTTADNPVSATQVGTWTVVPSFGTMQSSVVASAQSSALLVRIVGGVSSAVDNPVRAVLSSTTADNPVSATQVGTWTVVPSFGTLQSSAVASAQSSALLVRLVGGPSSAVDVQIRPVFSSTNTDNPVRAVLSSTTADNPVSATQVGTWTMTIGAQLQSTAAPSSGSSGLIVRQVIDLPLTFVSTNAFASTLAAINSTVTGARCKVFSYSVTSTCQTPTKISFYGGSSLKWALILGSLSSAVTGANLAVSPPAFLFGCAAGSSMTLRTPSSVAGFKVAVGYFMGA